MIVLCRNPTVKGRKTEAPIFTHANVGHAPFAGEFLKCLDVDAEVVCCLFCCKERFKEIGRVEKLMGRIGIQMVSYGTVGNTEAK